MTEKSDLNEKIQLWTAQSKIVIDTLNTKGVYKVKKQFVLDKYEEVSSIFSDVYNWYTSRAEKIVPRPLECEYPIWLFTDPRYTGHSHDTCLLKIEVDIKKVILFDPVKWNKILNLSYIPDNNIDAKNYEALLKQYNINDDTDIYMKSYYPHLKAKVKQSWDKLFDKNSNSSNYQQASLWEIKKEWIIDEK